jgi:hypothetical protein
VIGRFDPERGQIFKERELEIFGEFGERDIRLVTASNRLVIDVGKIEHAVNDVPSGFQVAMKQVLENVGSKIPNVRERINGRAAGIHLHDFASRVHRLKDFNLTSECVEELNRHAFEFREIVSWLHQSSL